METLIQINRGFFRKDMFKESKERSAFLKKSARGLRAKKLLLLGALGPGLPLIGSKGGD
jgi:hypothetical protein